MFFRRKAKPAGPIKGEDGNYYVDEEGEYDSDEWETDSDYSSENESDEENKQDLEEDDGSDVKASNAAKETEKEKDVASEQHEGVNDDGEENTNEIVVNKDAKDKSEETAPDTKEVENTESVLDTTNGHALDLEEVNRSTDSTGMVSVNIDEETTEDQFEASKKEVEGSPTQDASNSEEKKLTMTLEEKRSLVVLAAEHDRVDILKTILQPHPAQRTDDSNPIFSAQLLLNNIIVKDPSNAYTEEDLEKVFIPPLHVAIASSATNAATCLLRMGSDPSIRPNIPESDEWEGPSWQDENGELYAERGAIGAASSWKLFHGVSAWELAFGTLQIPTSNEKDDVKSKSNWFGFRSKTSANDEEEAEEKKLYIPIEIEGNKLEGIKHAFTAEALRAIGSDEVTRLSELINSGLGTTSRIEIGGKDLFAWCQEMNAQNCIAMLESMNASTDPEAEYYEANDNSDGESESYEEVEAEDEASIVEEETAKIESTMGGSDDESTTEYDEARLEEMTNKLEESDALSSALSTILDHIAEEVAITEGLIMQQGDSSNTTLLSQVRVLKIKRAELEDELPRQQRILEDRYAELDMVKIWWKKQGGSLREIPTRMDEYKKQKEEDAKRAIMTGNFKEDIKKVTQKLEESEKKVRKIRSSIAELSQVSVKNLKEVEKLGLLGAVNLTRKLKDEVRVRKDSLEAIRKEEKSVQDQVTLIRTLIEEKQVVKKTENQIPEVADDLEAERVEQIIDSVRPESPVLKTEYVGRPVSSDDEDSFESVEGDHDESSSSGENDSYSESDSDSCDSDDNELTHSQAIQTGQSTEIVPWVDDGDLGVFTFKVWNLLQRMFGLSKKAIKETAKSTVEEVGNLPRVLII